MKMKNERLLIIDDEPIICRGLERELMAAGYEAESAANCNEAIQKVKMSHFDLIFVDKPLSKI